MWLRGGTVAACVELHRTLALLPAPAALVWRRLASDARAIEIAGARTETPRPAAAAMIVGLHAAQHGVRDAKHMRDLRQALAREDDQTWRSAAALARELGAGDEFAAGLRLDPASGELADRLELAPNTGSRFVRLRVGTAPRAAFGIERLVSARGARARLRLVVWTLVPSRGKMLAMYPLARRGREGHGRCLRLSAVSTGAEPSAGVVVLVSAGAHEAARYRAVTTIEEHPRRRRGSRVSCERCSLSGRGGLPRLSRCRPLRASARRPAFYFSCRCSVLSASAPKKVVSLPGSAARSRRWDCGRHCSRCSACRSRSPRRAPH